MPDLAQDAALAADDAASPRIIFVFGKGGVGRSTVAAALGVGHAARGERVLIVQLAVFTELRSAS